MSERAHSSAPPFQIEPSALGFDWFWVQTYGFLHLFRQQKTFIENAAVKTAAFSRLTTEIPQTDFCFNYLTGTPFQECPSFLFVPIQFSASQLISLEVAAISQTVAFSA